jgi:sulfate/thiosulfate transport system permease protein
MTVQLSPPPAEVEATRRSAPHRALARVGGRALRRGGGPVLLVTYLSLLVLLPVAALCTQAFRGGLGAFWDNVTAPEALNALELTVVSSALVALCNAVAGTVIAWVLVRDQFFGKAVLNAVIDLPFALPTVVAGLTLLSMYGPSSPFHLNAAGTRWAVVMALAFVTLPFCVRTVQPVLASLETDQEEAAASLGASDRTTFRRVILPALIPAMVAGGGLAFARALGEFGSVILFSGNLPFKTEVSSEWIYNLTASGSLESAAAVSVLLLSIALGVLLVLGRLRRHFVLASST